MRQEAFSFSSKALTRASASAALCAEDGVPELGADVIAWPYTCSSPKPPQAGFVWWMSRRRTVSPTCPRLTVTLVDGYGTVCVAVTVPLCRTSTLMLVKVKPLRIDA